jgi:hypothetical protein
MVVKMSPINIKFKFSKENNEPTSETKEIKSKMKVEDPMVETSTIC